jgi:hypothetical protein
MMLSNDNTGRQNQATPDDNLDANKKTTQDDDPDENPDDNTNNNPDDNPDNNPDDNSRLQHHMSTPNDNIHDNTR